MNYNSHLATVQDTPTGFMQLAQFHSNEKAAKEMAGFPPSFDRIKIPSGGGTNFELPSLTGDDTEATKEICGVVLHHHPMQTYFRGKYSGGNEKPECYSLDAEYGVGKPGGACEECSLNRFGTGENNSKACKKKHRIYLLREGEIFPVILDLPTGSVRDFGVYLRRLMSRGMFSDGVVTRFGLKRATNSTGIVYSQATFALDRPLTAEELPLLASLCKQVRAHTQSAGYVAEAESMEAGVDYDPATGEIYQPMEEF